MRQQVLKALANPAHIFYVPYTLAVLNFIIQFVLFVVIFTVAELFAKVEIPPVFFLLSVLIVHLILAYFSKREPQLGQIISAKIQLFKLKIPRRLIA